ncbi:MAG: hypothetical protein ACXVBW_00205 [Bdellovibrionota bacterium]
MELENHWKKCSSCKKPLPYSSKYWVCNVSTCNRKRTGLAFCSVSCWDAHVPMMNHRESWAEERRAPTRDEWAKTLSGEDKPERKPRAAAASEAPAVKPAPVAPKVILRRSGSSDKS